MRTPTRKARDRPADQLDRQLRRLRGFTLDVLLSVKRRALTGFTPPEKFVIRAPISLGTLARLERTARILTSMQMPPAQAFHYAALTLAILDQFPHNGPFFSSMPAP